MNQHYYELPKKTIRSSENIYHNFKSSNFRIFQNLYQDKASMDTTPNEYNFSIFTCWNKKTQPLDIDMTKDNFIGRYRLGSN